MPRSEKVSYDGYFNSSPECWVLFEEILAGASGDPQYQPVHQLIIDAYAAQHAGGKHPDRSVIVHLAGLYAAFELKMPFAQIPPLLKRLATAAAAWPHLVPPEFPAPLTVLELATADGAAEGVPMAGTWAQAVWNSWAEQHETVARFVQENG
jgi:hypothetical protein